MCTFLLSHVGGGGLVEGRLCVSTVRILITYRQTVSVRRVRNASAGHIKSRNPPDRSLFHQRNPLSRHPQHYHIHTLWTSDIPVTEPNENAEKRQTSNEEILENSNTAFRLHVYNNYIHEDIQCTRYYGNSSGASDRHPIGATHYQTNSFYYRCSVQSAYNHCCVQSTHNEALGTSYKTSIT
jgi:hypothetical protein